MNFNKNNYLFLLSVVAIVGMAVASVGVYNLADERAALVNNSVKTFSGLFS